MELQLCTRKEIYFHSLIWLMLHILSLFVKKNNYKEKSEDENCCIDINVFSILLESTIWQQMNFFLLYHIFFLAFFDDSLFPGFFSISANSQKSKIHRYHTSNVFLRRFCLFYFRSICMRKYFNVVVLKWHDNSELLKWEKICLSWQKFNHRRTL